MSSRWGPAPGASRLSGKLARLDPHCPSPTGGLYR